MAMAPGRKYPITVKCGGQTSRPAGLRTAMVAGSTNHIGDGPGFLLTTGAGLLITTGVGCRSTADGVGGPVRLTDTRSTVRSGRRLMFRSSAGVVASDSASEAGAELAGSRWDLVTISTPGGAVGAVDASTLSGSATTTVAAVRRCTAARDSRT